MREISFIVEEVLIDRANMVARSEGKTLETAFREWLESYASRCPTVESDNPSKEDIEALLRRLRYVRAGRKFTRDEMNER